MAIIAKRKKGRERKTEEEKLCDANKNEHENPTTKCINERKHKWMREIKRERKKDIEWMKNGWTDKCKSVNFTHRQLVNDEHELHSRNLLDRDDYIIFYIRNTSIFSSSYDETYDVKWVHFSFKICVFVKVPMCIPDTKIAWHFPKMKRNCWIWSWGWLFEKN